MHVFSDLVSVMLNTRKFRAEGHEESNIAHNCGGVGQLARLYSKVFTFVHVIVNPVVPNRSNA